jgi:hypothetical protein
MKFTVSIAFLALSIYSVPSAQGFSTANSQTQNAQVASNETPAPPKSQEGSTPSIQFAGFSSPSYSEANDDSQQGVMSVESEPQTIDIEQFKV